MTHDYVAPTTSSVPAKRHRDESPSERQEDDDDEEWKLLLADANRHDIAPTWQNDEDRDRHVIISGYKWPRAYEDIKIVVEEMIKLVPLPGAEALGRPNFIWKSSRPDTLVVKWYKHSVARIFRLGWPRAVKGGGVPARFNKVKVNAVVSKEQVNELFAEM